MAFSQSIRRAQIPKLCELCETDTNIKWKCVQCNTLMCDKCKKIHLKVLTHDIVDVKSAEAKTELEQTIITDNIPCQIHKRKLNCMFCRTCDVLVCPECISDSHRKHDLDSIDKVCSEKKSELQDLESQFSNKFELCKIESSKVQDFKTKYEQFYTKAVKKNDQQENFIVDEVRKYAKDIREQLKSERQRIEKYVAEKEKDIAEVKENLLNKQRNIQEALESNQGAQVFSAYPEFSKKDISNASFNDLPEDTKDFFPAKDNLKNISNLFGSLQKTKLPTGLPQVNLDVIKSYTTTDQNMVDRMVMIDDKTAWISNFSKSTLRKINIDDTIKTVKDMSVIVYDMSLTDNDVLLSLNNSTDVSLLTTKTGEIKPFLSVSPLITRGIHVTKHNEIILGVKERSDKLTDTSCRKIIIFGMDGKQTQSFEYDKLKQRLFNVPYRITSNVDLVANDILVIDRASKDDGRVVVLDREGHVKWTYQGNPRVNPEGTIFNPTDIVTTSVGHVIVTDITSYALHVLSREGDLLTCKVMTDQGIMYPWSLDIDRNGQLWLGCYSGDDQRADAKLHVVEMSF